MKTQIYVFEFQLYPNIECPDSSLVRVHSELSAIEQSIQKGASLTTAEFIPRFTRI